MALLNASYLPAVVLVSSLIFLPLIPGGPFYLYVLVLTLYYATLGVAWDILGGYTGQGSFFHAAFVGIGAYTSVVLFIWFTVTPYISMFIGSLISTLVALFVGYLCFRFGLRGHFFFLASIAFLVALRYSFINWPLVGGATGLIVPLVQTNPSLYLQFSSTLPYYYFITALLLAEVYLSRRLLKSKLGYYFLAIKEDELAAASLGINTLKYKLLSFAISAALTSFAGTFYAFFVGYIEPQTVLSDILTVMIVIVAVFGGIGTTYGPILGAFILIPLIEYTRVFLGGRSGLDLIMLALTIILTGALYPHGVYSLFRKAYAQIAEAR